MKCINFDREFERYMMAWMKDNAAKYKSDMDVIEGMLPEIYMEFLSKPAAFIDGMAPKDYFARYDDAQTLVSLMCEYMANSVPVPDLLQERIGELGAQAEESLIALLDRTDVPEEAQMTAISLLQELDSTAPMQRYVTFIAKLSKPDEKGDRCAEALLSMGDAVIEPILASLDASTQTGRDIFADILCNFPGDERIFALLMERFAHCEDRMALFASYLAKYGDDRALDALYAAAQNQQISYLDYVEIVSAIDELGGDRPPEREFAGDPYYESLKQLSSC